MKETEHDKAFKTSQLLTRKIFNSKILETGQGFIM